jgi:hypothetical protein
MRTLGSGVGRHIEDQEKSPALLPGSSVCDEQSIFRIGL